jgi:hypothetical protein
MLCGAGTAYAQSEPRFLPGAPTRDTNPQPVKSLCWDGTAFVTCRAFPASGSDWRSVAGAAGIVNTTTAVTLKTAAAAGVRNYVAWCTLAHDTLGGVTELVLRDGAAGTVIFRTKLQTTALATTVLLFPVPLRGTAATLLEAATLTAVSGGVYLNCGGYSSS